MNYKGIIIEESLRDRKLPEMINVVSTKIETVTASHKTPWLTQWTLHTIEIPEEKSQDAAELISNKLETEHNWYADFKNDLYHYIIFRDKVFKVNRNNNEEYQIAKKYGISIGIPDYQLDFSPQIQ